MAIAFLSVIFVLIVTVLTQFMDFIENPELFGELIEAFLVITFLTITPTNLIDYIIVFVFSIFSFRDIFSTKNFQNYIIPIVLIYVAISLIIAVIEYFFFL